MLLLVNVCRIVLNKDSGKIAESLMQLPIRTIGAVSVLLVTKDLTLVPVVTVLFSKTVPAVNPDGSKTDPTDVSNVIPSVLFVLDLVIISAQIVLLDSSSIKEQPVLLPAQKVSSARMSQENQPVLTVLLAARNVFLILNVKAVTEDSN